MQPDVLSDDRLLALPDWKQLLWHDTSLNAKLKDAFAASDYDSTSDLNADSPKLTQLYNWLVRLSHIQRAMQHSIERAFTDDLSAGFSTFRSSVQVNQASMASLCSQQLGVDFSCRQN